MSGPSRSCSVSRNRSPARAPARAGPSAGRPPAGPSSLGPVTSVQASIRSARASASARRGPPSLHRRVRPRSPRCARAAARSIPPTGSAGTVATSTPSASRARRAWAGAERVVSTRTGVSWAVRASTLAGESCRCVSRTSRSGARPASPGSRTVSDGSSARAVPMPMRIASACARQRWTAPSATGPVIRRRSGPAAAQKPSRVRASLRCRAGRPRVTRVTWPIWSRAASSRNRPVSTATPPCRRRSWPRPATRGSGSSRALTTRAIPEARTASVQGGVRP